MAESTDLRHEIRRLEERLDDLAHDLARLKARAEGREVEEGESTGEAESLIPEGAARALSGVPALVGRTCLVLGGAFLLRHLTESGTLTDPIGITVGVAYAIFWLILADRSAARGLHMGGAFHAVTGSMIAYPLVWKATTKFHVVPPAGAAVLLAAMTAGGLGVAWRRRFRTVAWIAVLAALATGVGLLFATKAVVPFTLVLLALAFGSLILAYGRGWRWQRWLVALTLDGMVAFLVVLRLAPPLPDWLGVGAVVLAGMGLVVLYLGTFVVRLLVHGRDVTAFVIVQTSLVFVVGFEGSVAIAGDGYRAAFGIAALLAAIGYEIVAFFFSDRQEDHRIAFGYFASLGAGLLAASARLLLPTPWAATVWALLAVASALLARSGRRPTLEVHAALLAGAATLLGGLGAVELGSFVGHAEQPLGAWHLIVLALIFVAYLVPRVAEVGVVVSTARLLHLALVATGLGAVAVAVTRSIHGGDLGLLATITTAILALAAFILALVARTTTRGEARILMILLLIAGGGKLVIEDLRLGRPATLVISLGLYGAALILAPKLARRGEPSAPASE